MIITKKITQKHIINMLKTETWRKILKIAPEYKNDKGIFTKNRKIKKQ
jgi:hypothetical protein